ncbi:hypothetical protein ACHHYP_05478 [Achlya hypogyna]|uniref:Uncharacterized protein n=1 Tax=Achlya hypogyna TaxID=1202772 RepID=A0A1V9YXR0_ACHHY|nr:hypothetical protein ACHHYP_05478 [Achlya hypogyna]
MAAPRCHFRVEHCRHDAVFQSKYTRYQKAQKVKVLRCFPHCCPGHVYYRYCGAPISVYTELPNMRPLGAYATLLKIAPAYDSDWAIGDELPPCTAADLKTLSEANGSAWHIGQNTTPANNVLASAFNNDLIDGWAYGWKSGRSQVVRDCLHHVKVFVFEIVPAGPDVRWRVIARAFSPGFTFVSYRSLHYANTAEAAANEAPPTALVSLEPPPAVMAAPVSPREVSTATELMANRLGLLVLYLSTRRISTGSWQQDLGRYLARVPPTAPVALLFDPPTPDPMVLHHHNPVFRGSTDPHPHLSLVDHWLVHLLHPRHVARYNALATAHRDSVLDKAALMAAYNDIVHTLHDISEAYLQGEHGSSVGALAKAVAAACPHLESELQTQVAMEGYFGYHSVVAHLREVYLGMTGPTSMWPHKTRPSRFCGAWTLDCEASTFTWPAASVLGAVRMASWVYGCHAVWHPGNLHVRSSWLVYASPPSHFMLDHEAHVLRTFPNGESTMSGHGFVLGMSPKDWVTVVTGWLDGDYVGWETAAGNIVIECYRYDLQAREGWRVVLQVSRPHEHLAVDIQIHHLTASIPEDVSCWNAAARVRFWRTAPFDVVGDAAAVYAPMAAT